MGRQARPCYFLNFGYNRGSDCFKVMDAETGRIVYSRDVTWHLPREPLISPAPTVGSGVPDYMHIQPSPAATATPTAAPVPASANAALAPLQNSPASILDRIVRELGHETGVCMPGRTRGETRAMREAPHSVGLMSHAALAQEIATCEAFDEAFRERRHLALTFRLPPPATCQSHLAFPRRSHQSTLRYGVVPGHENSAAYCRPTRSAPRSSQFFFFFFFLSSHL